MQLECILLWVNSSSLSGNRIRFDELVLEPKTKSGKAMLKGSLHQIGVWL